jgi:hypothetical protein
MGNRTLDLRPQETKFLGQALLQAFNLAGAHVLGKHLENRSRDFLGIDVPIVAEGRGDVRPTYNRRRSETFSENQRARERGLRRGCGGRSFGVGAGDCRLRLHITCSQMGRLPISAFGTTGIVARADGGVAWQGPP